MLVLPSNGHFSDSAVLALSNTPRYYRDDDVKGDEMGGVWYTHRTVYHYVEDFERNYGERNKLEDQVEEKILFK
jgi:hypothetical protein